MARGGFWNYVLTTLLIVCGTIFFYNMYNRGPQVVYIEQPSIKQSYVPKILNCSGKISSEVNVYTRNSQGWKLNSDVCSKCFSFPKATLRTPFGNTPIFIYEGKNDIWVSTSLKSQGTFESTKAQLMYRMLKEDPSLQLIDIGANLGVYSLSIAKLGRKVLAVEALDKNLQHVCASVMAGDLQDKLTLVHNAISNDHQEVNLGVDRNNMGGTFVDVDSSHIKDLKLGRAQGTYGKVLTITMDDLLSLPVIEKFKRVFIKMDIEGFEAKALEKSYELFKKLTIVAFVMEWEFHKGQKTADSIIAFMTKHKYKPYSVAVRPVPLNIAQKNSWPYDVVWLPDKKL